ncbi:MAG: hypothetical protein Q9160_006307 [Pyrenula sp. 1 TL-2023]
MSLEDDDWNAFTGIKVLKRGKEPVVDVLSVVAVHGLGANPNYAWTWRGEEKPDGGPRETANWLTEFLPEELPDARIMTYGYDSRWHRNAPVITMFDIANSFMKNLGDQRTGDTQKRPLVFVGHSLGGVIIERMLMTALNLDDYKHVADSTVGIVFLGSPLKGTRLAEWAHLAAIVGRGLGYNSNPRVVEALREGSESMTDLLNNFTRWVQKKQVTVCCFFEAAPTSYSKRLPQWGQRWWNPSAKIAVPKDNAVFDGAIPFPLWTDHFKINKYRSREDSSYKQVSAELVKMAHKCAKLDLTLDSNQVHGNSPLASKIKNKDFKRLTSFIACAKQSDIHAPEECIKILAKVDPEHDLRSLKMVKGERVLGTCEWLPTQENYRMWLSELGIQVLCLEGNPGTGKTMMSTFLIETIQARAAKHPEKTHLAYYFCKNADDDRNNAAGILRGLIWQILRQSKDKLINYIVDPFKDRGKDRALFDDVHALWDILINMTKADTFQELFIVIDGIDECQEGSREQLLHNIRSLASQGSASSTVRFILCGRPIVSFGPTSDAFRKIRIDTEKISDDLPRFIDARVRETAEEKSWPSNLTEDVREHLIKTAEGTFLYVGLFLEQVKKLRPSEVDRQLSEHELPKSLQGIYARILREMPMCDKPAAAWILHCVICSVRPLTVEELATARYVEEIGLQDRSLPSSEEAERFLDTLELCKSLLVQSNGTITIIHQTVKDFLMSADVRDNPELNEFYVDNGAGNWLLFKICAKVLNGRELDKVASAMERRAELEDFYRIYMSTRLAGCMSLGERSPCRIARPGDYWITVRNSPIPLVTYAADFWETHVIRAAENGFVQADILIELPPLRTQLARCWLRASVEHGQFTQVKLMQKYVPSACDSSNKSFKLWETPLICATKQGNIEIVELILSMDVFDVGFQDWRGRTALIYAAKSGYEEIVKLLLNTGNANLNCKDRYGFTAYRYATKHRHEEVKNILWNAESMRYGKMEMLTSAVSGSKSWYAKHKIARSTKKLPTSSPESQEKEETDSTFTPSIKLQASQESLTLSESSNLKPKPSRGSLRPPTSRLSSHASNISLADN